LLLTILLHTGLVGTGIYLAQQKAAG